MTLDVNGNRYAWNSRNQMTGITGNLSAAFTYDALGRRVSKRIGSQTTTFQYDQLNRVTRNIWGYNGNTSLRSSRRVLHAY